MPAFRRLTISASVAACALAAAGSSFAATGEQTPLHVTHTATQAPSTSIGFMRMLIVLLFFGALLFVARLMLKRAGRNSRSGGGARNGITVVATTPLAANRSLHVIQVGGKNLLVGATDGGISTIAELTDEEVETIGEDDRTGGRPSFGAALASAAQTQFGGKRQPSAALPRRSLLDWIRERTVR